MNKLDEYQSLTKTHARAAVSTGWRVQHAQTLFGNTSKVNFVRNKEVIDAEKCEYYVGNNKNLKSRQTETKLGTPKRLMIMKEFRQNGLRALRKHQKCKY